MKVTRKEPVHNPVFIELEEKEAEILTKFMGHTSTHSIAQTFHLDRTAKVVLQVNSLCYELYCKLGEAGVKYARI